MAEREVAAVFQGHASFGGWVRVAFDGDVPVLPPAPPALAEADDFEPDYDPGFE